MRTGSLLSLLEQLREVKVEIFFRWKVCNLFMGKVLCRRERTSDVEVQWEMRGLEEKLVEVTVVASEVEGGEVGESM